MFKAVLWPDQWLTGTYLDDLILWCKPREVELVTSCHWLKFPWLVSEVANACTLKWDPSQLRIFLQRILFHPQRNHPLNVILSDVTRVQPFLPQGARGREAGNSCFLGSPDHLDRYACITLWFSRGVWYQHSSVCCCQAQILDLKTWAQHQAAVPPM